MNKRKFDLEGLLEVISMAFRIALIVGCVCFVRWLFVADIPAEELTGLEWLLILPLGVVMYVALRYIPYLLSYIIDKIFPEQY